MLYDKNPLMTFQIKLWREQIKPSITKAFELSPDDKLSWSPAPEMITLGSLYKHISECSEWWFDQVIGNRKSEKSTAFSKKTELSRNELSGFLEAHWDRLERFFSCDPSILRKSYEVASRENAHNFDGYWIFTHLLEHDIHHRSQINQYLRLLGIVPPRI